MGAAAVIFPKKIVIKNWTHENFSFCQKWLKYAAGNILGQKNHFFVAKSDSGIIKYEFLE